MPEPGQSRLVSALKGPLAPVLTAAAIIVVWEIGVRWRDVPKFLLPAPSAIAAYLATHVGLLWHHALATLSEALLGFGIAVVFAIVMATLMVWSRTFENAVYPLMVTTQVIPKVAIAPLLVVYLGFNAAPKVFLAFLLSFFPIVVNTTLGLKSVKPELLEYLATLRATRTQVLLKVQAKQALPYFLEGAKIGITLGRDRRRRGGACGGQSRLGFLGDLGHQLAAKPWLRSRQWFGWLSSVSPCLSSSMSGDGG